MPKRYVVIYKKKKREQKCNVNLSHFSFSFRIKQTHIFNNCHTTETKNAIDCTQTLVRVK